MKITASYFFHLWPLRNLRYMQMSQAKQIIAFIFIIVFAEKLTVITFLVTPTHVDEVQFT